MLKRMGSAWKRVRANKMAALAIDIVIVLPLVVGIMAWQERHMLPADGETAGPSFELVTLDGRTIELGDHRGRQVLLYFFAPWCSVCHVSVENVEDIRKRIPSEELSIFLVALDWPDRKSVERFAALHGLTVPVLLGNESVKAAYRVDAYPSYYVLDVDGNVTARSRGYSTEIGMRLRL